MCEHLYVCAVLCVCTEFKGRPAASTTPAAGAGTYEAEKTVFKQTESHLAGETNVEHDLKIFFTCVCVSVRASVCGVYTHTHTLFNRSLTW